MNKRIRDIGLTRLLWSLALGLGLALGLLYALTSRSAAEAQAADPVFRLDYVRPRGGPQNVETAQAVQPGPSATPAHEAPWDQVRPGDVPPPYARPSARPTVPPLPTPPSGESRPPDQVPSHTRRATPGSAPAYTRQGLPDGPRAASGALPSGSASEAAGVRASNAAPLTPPMPGNTDLAVCMTTDRVWGVVGAGETVTVTVNGTQMGAAPADGKGFFWTTLYDGSGNRPGLAAGDVVRIYHDGVQAASVTLRSITGQVDVVNDVVSGTIGGAGHPISVTIYAPWGEPSMIAYSQTVSTDGSGNFTADFSAVWDLRTWDEALVAYVQGGIEVHRHVYPAASLLVRPAPWNNVMGYAAPGTSVVATVYLSDAVTVKASDTLVAGATDGRYRWDVPTDVVEGDVVVVQLAGGTTMSRTVDTLSMNVDAANDRVTGEGEPGATVRGVADLLTPLGWREVQASTTADPATGAYTLEFGSVTNLLPGYWVGVLVTDDEGDDLNLWERTPSVEVHQTWNEVYGCGPSPVGPESEGRAVTLTLYSAASDATFVYVKQMSWSSWYYFSEGEDGLPDIAPGDVVTVEAEGYAWQGVVHVLPMTLQHDAAADRFTGTVVPPTERVELWGSYWQGWLYPAGGQFDMLVTATSAFTASPPGFDVRGDLQYEATHRTAGDYAERAFRYSDGFGTAVSFNGFDGALNPPGLPYTITLYDGGGNVKAQLTDVSQEPAGSLGWHDLWNTGEQVLPGDGLQVQSAAGFSHTAHIPAIVIEADLDADVVSGQGPANTLLYVEVSNQGRGYVPTDGSGQFAVAVDQLQDVWGSGDLQWTDRVDVTYYDENNTWIVYTFLWPRARVNYAYDYVSGDYAAGHTVWITVTDGAGAIRATAAISSNYGRSPGGEGFDTRWEDWSPQQPDIAAGDWVYVRTDDGTSNTIHVGTITGDVDVDENTVAGTISAGWFTQTLGMMCQVWAQNGPGMNVTVEPDGGSYVCDFEDVGWDLLPGQNVAVLYYEPGDSDEIFNVFRGPAPDVRVEKWVEGGGEASPGGTVVYGVYYYNNGDAPATGVVLTDTLPTSTTYNSDDSGFTAHPSGNVVTWSLGTLLPRSQALFHLVLDVDSGVAISQDIASNAMAIAAANYEPPDWQWDNWTESGSVHVSDQSPDLYVSKYAYPGDPAPGQTFLYEIYYHNQGPVASGPVWLTDTLPLSTTLVSWYSDNGYTLWTQVPTTGGQLVLSAPALPSYWGDYIMLRLRVDDAVPYNTQLVNTVEITTAGDSNPDNNRHVLSDVWVSPPRWNVYLDKYWSWGYRVPGAQVGYNIYYRNNGNVATQARLTDTLPAGTTFVTATRWTVYGEVPVVPDYTGGGVVAWDVGMLEPGEWSDFNLRVAISSTIAPNTVITNCATIAITQTDEQPYDNTGCVVETVRAFGPNLRVDKESWWEGEGQIGYRIHFENAGTTRLENVWLTDTYPISTTFNDDWGVEWGPWITVTHDAPNRRLLFWVERLNPGDAGSIGLRVDLDEPGVRPRWYTNTVEIDTPPGEVYPADNTDTDVLVRVEVEWVTMLWVGTDHGNLWGGAQPSTTVTVTTPYTQVTAWANPDCGGCWGTGSVGPLYPGDTVTVEAGSGLLPVVIPIPDPFTAEADSNADTVSGQIGGVANEAVEVDGNWPDAYQQVPTDGSGYYTATYGDIPRGGDGYVRYETGITYARVAFHRSFRAPDLLLHVNYAHDWVRADYEAGHTVYFTITGSGGTIKATAAVSTTPGGGWDGDGCEPRGEDWQPQQPDVMPGDWVFGRVDNGYTTTVHLGTISGQVSAASDSISGTVAAAWWLPQTVDVQCLPWGAPWGAPNPQVKEDTVLPNGTDTYACAWNPATEWDVQPGQDIGIQYYEPDGDSVFNVFREPAPDVRVEKWVEGGGETSPGGTLVYGIGYYNDGDAAATGVVLTDTLPPSTTYSADSSGFTVHPDGDVVTWSLGTLLPRSRAYFHLALEVDSGAVISENIAGNVITVTASNEPPDWTWNNRAESGGIHVGDGSPDLSVWKYPNPSDPAPGQTFLYEIEYRNHGPVTSGPVVLTDTLPLSTTLVSWYSEIGYTLWTEEITSGGEFVLSAPALPGNWGDFIYLRLRVDDAVPYDTQLTNTVEITTSGDSNPDDNRHARDGAWVSPPHWDVYVQKWVPGSRLVPGETIGYSIYCRNNGNMATQAWLTDTLPTGTTFVTATRQTPYGYVPMAPSYVGGGLVAWDVGRLEPGEWSNLNLRVAISPTIVPDTVITNCATLAITQTDAQPYDNTDCVAKMVHAAGPNLQVDKESWWESEEQVNYRIHFENAGTTRLENVWITDTYPISTTFNDDWWVEGGPWITSTHNVSSHQLIFWVEALDPGNTGNIRFRVDVDEDARGVQGLVFTNTVEAPWPGDVYPADNSDLELAYTGPDVYVDKWLSGGKPRPGRIVTFTVEFGNRNRWPWDGDPGYGSHITDTLPPEMTFLTAVAPWDPNWRPNELPGNVLEWEWGTMWYNSTWSFDVVAQITDTVAPGTVMTNVIQAYGDSPYDVEPFWDNNVFELAITVAPTNTPPTLSGLPDQLFDHVTSPPGTIDLWAYAYDEDTPSSALTYTIAGTPPAGAGVTLSGNRTVTVNPSKTWCGGTDVTVRATDPGGLWDTDTFRVAVSWSCPGPVAMPGAPVLIAPVDGRTAHSNTPAFAWHAVEGAETYRIQVDDDTDFSTPERDETMASTDYLPAAGLSGGVHYWRVRAVSGSEVGAWSEKWAFTVPTSSPLGFRLYLPVVAQDWP